MKIVINTCYGGFCLSKEALAYLHAVNPFIYSDDRSNPALVECVETLGEKANGSFADLKVIEIPDGIKWKISDYDGIECVEEVHRWWNEYGEHFE